MGILDRIFYTPIDFNSTPRWVQNKIQRDESNYEMKFGHRPYNVQTEFPGNHYRYHVTYQTIGQGRIEYKISRKRK